MYTAFRGRRRPPASPAVRRAEAEPLVLDGVVMLLRLILRNLQAEARNREAAHGREDCIAADDDIALRIHLADLRGDDVRLRVEHVERGALADIALLDHAIECELGRGDKFA